MDRIDIKKYDIYALRLDFEFTAEEIADLSRNAAFRIQANASTASDKYLEELIRNKTEEAGENIIRQYGIKKKVPCYYR